MSVPSPEKLRLSSGISPVKMSQIPNKSMPRFLGGFIGRLLSANDVLSKSNHREPRGHPELRGINSSLAFLPLGVLCFYRRFSLFSWSFNRECTEYILEKSSFAYSDFSMPFLCVHCGFMPASLFHKSFDSTANERRVFIYSLPAYFSFIVLVFPLCTVTFEILIVPSDSCQASTVYSPGGISLIANAPFSSVTAA